MPAGRRRPRRTGVGQRLVRAASHLCGHGEYHAHHVGGGVRPGAARCGPEATFRIDETIPQLVNTLIAQQGIPGLRFIDRHGQTVPW